MAFLVLGDMTVQGDVCGVDSARRVGAIGMDDGARCALTSLAIKRQFLEVSGDLVQRALPVFYADCITAGAKAVSLG